MEYHAGIDVSLERSSVCVVDATGRVIREAKVASEPEALIAWFRGLGLALARVGLEAGPLSQWLYAAMRDAGLAVELLETRHVRDAFKAMPVKTDRKDARGIAQLLRLGWFRPVHCKSVSAQETRALLAARKPLQTKRLDVEMSLRGVLRGFGLKVGFASRWRSRSFCAASAPRSAMASSRSPQSCSSNARIAPTSSGGSGRIASSPARITARILRRCARPADRPRALQARPVETVEQRRELRSRQSHDAVRHRRPHEATPLHPLPHSAAVVSISAD